MTLGDLINEYRVKNNISMEEFAAKAGLSKGYISMLEKNINPKTNQPIAPSLTTIKQVSIALGLEFESVIGAIDQDVNLEVEHPHSAQEGKNTPKVKGVKIPVLGKVAAGIPVAAIEDIIDYEEIPEAMAQLGEYFGLQIQGDSMEPRILDGDVVIVRKQEDASTGDYVIATVNGNDATCKKLKKTDNGLMLISINTKYEPFIYSWEEVKSIPICILGKVVELRAKF